ncbi:polysaccharide deacetylase family protein [Gloeocapsopsis sp. IPPAS B-1203]|uniref:polysaccharide deacetylase family protein n=1 Tax=Gloeocapsopsis sp. IPPAS B-1203 TaxID=2049454 RepID=UPI000C18ACFA|nr:polysaccharide deacetylase family protein [Gloeocapsopsis sp. IPPAS B-1203]PIG94115.1 polysaccharide deacetylase [Gloeocapsopsis sp. IPPAS B-1203]
MRICGLSKLRRIARRLKNRFEPGGLILLYHRVAEVDSDPWSLCVTPQHFAEHLEVLQKYGCPMPLQQLTQNLQDGKLTHRSVSITFDDGYADNLHNAKPLLEGYDIPATVFLTSGYIGHEREFWWDELERLLLQPGTLPETLHLSIDGNTYQWKLGEAADYTEEAYQRHCCWQFEHKDTPSQRHALYRSVYQLLCFLRAGDRQKVLDDLLVWSGTELENRPTHRCLSVAQAIALEQEGLIEIGSHTVTHPFLSTLPLALQQDEILQSKAQLEKIVGHAVSSFAYPHGNYTAETATLVRQAGFTCACSTDAETVWSHTNGFQLPRVVVEDWDGEEFARRLKEWFDG